MPVCLHICFTTRQSSCRCPSVSACLHVCFTAWQSFCRRPSLSVRLHVCLSACLFYGLSVFLSTSKCFRHAMHINEASVRYTSQIANLAGNLSFPAKHSLSFPPLHPPSTRGALLTSSAHAFLSSCRYRRYVDSH